MGSDPARFFANLFLYVCESKWMNKLKKFDLIKSKKRGNNFRFIDDLNSMNHGGEFESNYSNIYPEKLHLAKENTDTHEASLLDSNMETKDRKFHILFLMSDKSSNAPSGIVSFHW